MVLPEEKKYTIEDIFNLPEGVRAELIDGQIYDMALPSRTHQKLLMKLSKTIDNYIESKNGSCEVYPAPFAVFINKDDTKYVEPDISVICDPEKLNDKGCVGAPDWIIEITSPSNSPHDYIKKLNLYADAGVREYWIVNPLSKDILVYFFEQTPFAVWKYTFQDKIKVNIYNDFTIDFDQFDI